MTDLAPDAGANREQQFRRNALLFFLPLVISNMLAGVKIMASNPGLMANEHWLGFLFAFLLSAAALALWRDINRLMPVSYFTCGALAVFFLYRQASLLYGPSSTDDSLPMFMPLYGYYAMQYFAFFVFLPRSLGERCCWLFWLGCVTTVLSRLLTDWDYFSQRHGAVELIVYMVIANPMFILLGRILLKIQDLLGETERELAQSRKELELLERVTSVEERFQRAVNGSRDGLWEWCESESPQFWASPQFGRLLGVEPGRQPGSLADLLVLVRYEDRQQVAAQFDAAMVHLDGFEMDCALRTHSGNYQWFSIKGVASRSSSGKVYVSGSLQSIQRRRQAEEKMRASNEALSQFAGVAAHDLRAPIRKISSYGDMMRRALGEQADKVEKQLGAIKRLTGHTMELIDRLLTYAAADTPTESSQVPMRVVLEDVLELLEADIQEKGAQVAVGELPEVWANPGDLRQIFQNLISNAMKFCDEAPFVEVAEVPGEHPSTAAVVVKDNGIGIEEKYLNEIREPLKRLHSDAEYEGFGLGLATVVRIIERNGGKLLIESTPGAGSTFTVCLPRSAPSDSDSA